MQLYTPYTGCTQGAPTKPLPNPGSLHLLKPVVAIASGVSGLRYLLEKLIDCGEKANNGSVSISPYRNISSRVMSVCPG